MGKIEELLDERIQLDFQNLTNAKPEEIESIGRRIAIFYELRSNEIKTTCEAEEKEARRIMEQDQYQIDVDLREREAVLEEKRLKEQIKDRYFRIVEVIATIGIPLIFYGIWMKKGFKFEETGTYTSGTFKNLFNRFKPTK